MTFIARRSIEADKMLVTSIARSTKVGDAELRLAPFTGEDGLLLLWWGPLVPVHPGDMLRHFLSPAGIAIEAVEPPSPVMMGPTLPPSLLPS